MLFKGARVYYDPRKESILDKEPAPPQGKRELTPEHVRSAAAANARLRPDQAKGQGGRTKDASSPASTRSGFKLFGRQRQSDNRVTPAETLTVAPMTERVNR